MSKGPTDGKDSIYRPLTEEEMNKCKGMTHKRAEQIFRFMFDQRPFVHVPQLGFKAHCATQQQMADGIDVGYDQVRKAIQLLLGHGALQVVTTGKPTNFALVNNSGYWQTQLVSMRRLESRGQCHGTTKNGERCKVGHNDASTLYISHRTEDGKWYCKNHAPDDAVHVEKSDIKWEQEVEKGKERNQAQPQMQFRRSRIAQHKERTALRATAKELGIEREDDETSGDFIKRLQDLKHKGELTILTSEEPPTFTNEVVVGLDEPDIVEAVDELMEEPTPEREYKTLWPETEGVWIDGIEYIPKSSTDQVPRESLENAFKRIDSRNKRIDELEAAIKQFIDGETTQNQLRGVVYDG